MEKLLLIDGHSILNRAFFGLPDLTNAKGVHTGAVYGFLNILFKVVDAEQPDYLTVAFDVHAPTFRHKMYEPYKGTRGPMAEELRQQVPMIKEMLHAMGIVTVEKEGFEADDVLGTLATRAAKEGKEVVILSGDRDLLQLAGEHIKISIPKTKRTGTEIEHYFAKDVLEQKQVTPTEFIDVKALWGDTSDNIPGVPGIGEKTATAIIVKYHSIEEAHAHADEIKPPRASKNLQEYYDQAVLSKELATIVVDADIDYELSAAKYGNPYTEEAYLLCKEWEFKNLLSRFEVGSPKNDVAKDFVRSEKLTEAERFLDELKEDAPVGIAVYAVSDFLAGIAVSDGERSILYVPEPSAAGAELASTEPESSSVGPDTAEAWLVRLVGMVSGHTLGLLDVKQTMKTLKKLGMAKAAEALFGERKSGRVRDISVASYLLNPLAKTYTADDVARDALGMTIPAYVDLFGKAKPPQAWDEMPEQMTTYLCYEAFVAAAAQEALLKQLQDTGMERLYFEVELPLVFTLYAMECEGIGIDGDALAEYGQTLVGGIDELEQRIHGAAGEEFNINSPKQLGEVLFGKLGLPGGKKTKTGYSTAADVLDKLSGDYPIVADILQYRQLTKLKSTYADGLADCIEEDGRIRTTFEQTVTATGRLSSTNPNLQNIPIRIELGKAIRKVFHPREGFVFVDADYSQIELRVLAHMSGDDNLIDAYRQNQDIHRATASVVFGVPFDEVTEQQRRNAKAVNFGIVYGISAFGLGEDLDISRQEAQKYIDDYYKAYPGLKSFLDGCVSAAKETGYSLTMYGRRRPIPELSSSNFMQRNFGERVAMNAPIQGTAADIIKIAMNRVYDRLAKEALESKLILQVHDELLIEAKEEEAQRIELILEEEMKHAAELAVELEIDVHSGRTWYDAK